MDRRIRRAALLMLVMFTVLTLPVISVQGPVHPSMWESRSANRALNSDPHNRHTVNCNFDTKRGPVLLADDTTIASTQKPNDGQGSEDYRRVYANRPPYAPVTEYLSPIFASMIGTGKEGSSVPNGDSPSLFSSQIKTLVAGDPQRGGAIELTIKPGIQQAACDTLAGREGVIVVPDPGTKAILTLVSTPSCDPSTFTTRNGNAASEASATLDQDSSRPLDNRAITSNYCPPGLTLKVLIATAMLHTGKVRPDQGVNTPDTITLPGISHSLESYEGESCGGSRTTFSHAFAGSHDTPFAQLAMNVGEEELSKETKSWGFDSDLSVLLKVTPSAYPHNDSQAQVMMAGVGQASAQATPLMIAIVTATMASKGEQTTPYLASYILDPDPSKISSTSTKVAYTLIDSATASFLPSLMQTVVAEDMGTSAQVSGVRVAGKTGTVRTDMDSSSTTWFVDFTGTSIDKPEVTLAVVLDGNAKTEDGATGGKIVEPVAVRVIDVTVSQ